MNDMGSNISAEMVVFRWKHYVLSSSKLSHLAACWNKVSKKSLETYYEYKVR